MRKGTLLSMAALMILANGGTLLYSVYAALPMTEEGKLTEEALQKVYTDEEVELLPAGYAWNAFENEAGETVYQIISNEQYAEMNGVEAGDTDDMGAEDIELSFDDPAGDYQGEPTREYMIEFLCNAAGKLPYAPGGRIYTANFLDMGSINNHMATYYGETGYGVDSIGLLYFVDRAVFGYTTHDFSDMMSLCNASVQVTADELLPGDIGMLTTEEGEPNRFGICVGYNGHVPVFAHMNTMPTTGFPAGVLEISELESVGGKYFNASAPVDFQYFMRLDFPWEGDT